MVSDVETFDQRVCELGEGPFYDAATGRVGWVDILGRRVLWRHTITGESDEISVPAHIGAAVPRRNGGFVLCLPDGPALHDPDGTLHELGGYAEADNDAGRPPATTPIRSNDAKPDPSGRLLLGTTAYDASPGVGALYRLDPSSVGVRRVLGGATISNGLGWTAEGTTMYYADTPTQRVDAFDYDVASGALSRRRMFVEISPDQGSPDGLCVDTDGGVWVALWGGGAVHRFAPDGTLDRVVHVPTSQVTSCAFAGERRDTLIITTARIDLTDSAAGRTYVHRPAGVSGVPVPPFAG